MRLARPVILGPTASPQLLAAESGCSLGSRTQALTAFTINFFFFFFQVTSQHHPSVPCAGHQRSPGRQRAVASRPARCLPPHVRSHAPSAHSPRGPRQGQRPPVPLPGPAPAPLQPRAALRGRGAQSRRGPRASPSLTKHLHSAGSGRGGGGGGLGPGPGPGPSSENGPFGGITFSPWTLQMPPLRAFKDLGMG